MTNQRQFARQIIVVRHGRTDANRSGVLQGRMDNPLNAEGIDQAQRVADLLAATYSDSSDSGSVHIVSSPLLRARQTAECIAERLKRDIHVDERWVELDYGVYDGTPLRAVPDDVWRRWRSDDTFAPEGGESLADVHTRVTSACDEMSQESAYDGSGTLVVVSHVSPIKSAVAWALGVTPSVGWRTHLDNGSITRIAVGPRGPTLAGFNVTGHLN